MSLIRFTIQPRHCALRYRHGVLEQVLPAGRHRRRAGQRLVVLDLRERLTQVSPQEVLTSDGVSVRVSAVVRWAVADPVAFVEVSEEPAATVYLAAQVALRDALATLTAEELVGRGAALPTERITAATAEVARRVGADVIEVVVKDVIVPVELRSAAAELATARRRGEAQLEAARAETAALRSLANGAKLLDAHPALARLRLVQAAPPGTRIVLAVSEAVPGAVSDAVVVDAVQDRPTD
ncbi:hypothetical protein GCM10009721_13740 [Terrabacter tumescens]|uniref:Band 7 domain-containing protein n=1 Tax=Terrabacter tumescens TaxID=60443 RepID=A0ABQ2HTU3_9MICO|nr:SPFH domain-containing protein [Terrabacter tumescens]GGM89679.1 hypothetical protein GCM10009721_13740 [Terrabacter tumescens]